MKQFFRQTLLFCVALLLIISSFPALAAAPTNNGELVVVSYQTSRSVINKGDYVDITLRLKHTGISTSEITADKLDITRRVDSFSGGSITKSVLSSGASTLEFIVTVSGLTYGGTGNSLKLMVGYTGLDRSYDTIELPITEAVEYQAPGEVTPVAVPEPTVLISRSDISSAIEAGSTFNMTVYFANLSSTPIYSSVASFTMPEGLMLVGGGSSFAVGGIPANGTGSVQLTVKAADSLSSSSQTISAALKFEYHNGTALTRAETSENITVPTKAVVRENIPQPTVLISCDSVGQVVTAGQEVVLNLRFKNVGKTAATDPIASFTASDSLIIVGSSALQLGDIPAGGTATASLRVRAASAITSPAQSVNVDLKFAYDSGTNGVQQGTASDRISIQAKVVEKETIPQPTLILTRSDLDAPIKAGESKAVVLYFENIGKTTVQDPVVTVSTSEGLMLTSSVSTFKLADIAPGKSGSVTVKVKAADAITASTQSISGEVRFSYDSGEGTAQGTSSGSVTLPSVVTVKQTVSQPTVIVSSSRLSKPVSAGEEVSLTVYFKNAGKTAITDPVATITVPDSFTLLNGVSTFVLSDIAPGASDSVTLKLRAGDTLSASTQVIGADLKFSYDSGDGKVQATTSDRVTLSAVVTEKNTVPQPTIIVTSSQLMTPISANQEISIKIYFKNAGRADLKDTVVTFSSSEALMIMNGVSTFVLGDIKQGESANVTLKLKASENISSTTQSVSADMKFGYDSGDGVVQATASERVNIAAKTTSPDDGKPGVGSPVPNVIVSRFDYGGDSVAAGGKFTLDFSFTNTSSSITVENIVATLDSGESFTIDGATNTFYYSSLAPGAEQSQQIPMQALAAAATGAQTMNITFKYEYTDNNTRSSASSDVKLSVPIYQPDRFEISAPEVSDYIMMGNEVYISLNYVNKGKASVNNVEARVDGGDSIDALTKVQNLGNFEAGKSGVINFIVTPYVSGEVNLTVSVTYEDANQQAITKEFPITMFAQEPYYPDFSTSTEPSVEPGKTGMPGWIWYVIAGVVVVAAIVIIIVVKKKKKAAAVKKDAESWDDWDDEKETAGSVPKGK